MKIRKNLSDEDMLKGYEEEVSFENAIYGDEPVKNKKLKTAKKEDSKEILLPDEALAKLNRYLLEISMDWFKNTTGRLLLNLPPLKRKPDGNCIEPAAGQVCYKKL